MFNLSDLHKITSILSPSGLIEQFKRLLHAYEEKIQENEDLKQEIIDLKNRLRDEIGEPKIPVIKKSKNKDIHHPPNKTRKERKKDWLNKKKKNEELKIDKEEKCSVDKETLPADAEFKGYREIIVQNIVLKSENTKFIIERFYSPSQKRYYEGKLPTGYKGSQFGPELRALIVALYVGLRSTENKIEKFLKEIGIVISSGEISRILMNVPAKMKSEMTLAREAGIKKNVGLNIDATGMRVGKESCFNLIHSNRYMSYHQTVKDRSRLEAIKSLVMHPNPIYVLDDYTLKWLDGKISKSSIEKIKKHSSEVQYKEDSLEKLVKNCGIYESSAIGKIKSGALISAWMKDLLGVRPNVLISDAAGEYHDIFDQHQDCWIHELRHYREIKISCDYVREELDEFFKLAWDLFDVMESYKVCPTLAMRDEIERGFANIFERQWNSYMIEHCREQTLKRKKNLLTFLDIPKIAVHNNQGESDVREKVIRRNISGGHKNWRGAAAGNMWISIYQTVRKNGVGFFYYLRDRYCELYEIAPLNQLIENRA